MRGCRSWLDGSGGHAQRQPWRLISEPQRAGSLKPVDWRSPPPHLSLARAAQPSPFHNPCPSSRAQREQIEKERLEEEKKASGRLQHANELRRQVRENQQKQVQDRIATFEEGRRLKEEAQKRRERIEDIKKKKIEELRCSSAAPRPVPKEMGWLESWDSGMEGALQGHSGMLPSDGAPAENPGAWVFLAL